MNVRRETATSRAGMLLQVAGAAPLWLATPALRPWHLRWGATPEEVAGRMPGDAVVPQAQFTATRAITVDAPSEAVWPWIVQLGYGRAGFYTYDIVDNHGRPSSEEILPGYQDLRVGDEIPMFHELGDLAIAYQVDSFHTNEWMLWVHRPHVGEVPDSTWSWTLRQVRPGQTRLVTRMKQQYRWETPKLAAFNLLLMEVGDFPMERRMLRGIKKRAEHCAGARAVRPSTGEAAE